jgi:hypothetical protein
MFIDKQKEKYSSLKVELIDLNILSYFYIRKINRLGYLFQKTSRHYLFEELSALRCMENGLILHLTNLDDDNSKFSFRVISKEINKTIKDQTKIKELKSNLTTYRKNVNTLKTQHRNKRIAHINYSEDLNIDEFLNFNAYMKPLISEANKIGDFIFGQRIEYIMKLGTHEGVLNFRDNFESLKFDINGVKGFV